MSSLQQKFGDYWVSLRASQCFGDHWRALAIFPLLAFFWVGDTLVLDRDLSAFDVILRLSNWTEEYPYQGVQEMILSDSPQAHYPERELKWGTMAQGHRLNYNPYIFSGLEDSAQGIGGFVTSPFQLFMPIDEAIDWSTWLRLALAGIFMYILLVGVGLSRMAAIFGGALWAFNTHQIVWLEFPQHLATQLWIPLIFYLDYKILTQGFTKSRVAGLLLVNLFFYTSGYTQIVLYTYMTVGIFNTVYLLTAGDRTLKQRLLTWSGIHLVFLAFVAFLLPRLMLDGELIQDGLRGAQTFRTGLKGVSHDVGAVLALIKNLLPDIADFKRLYSPSYLGGLWDINYHGPGSLVEFGAYFGLVSILLLPFAIPAFANRNWRPLLFSVVAIVAFSFGMIHRDPLLKEIVNIVPMAGLGSYSRFITLALFCLSILSAFGVHQLQKHYSNKSIWIIAGFTIALMIVPSILQRSDPSIDTSQFRYAYYLSVALGALLLITYRLKLQSHLAYLLVIFTIVDLFFATYEFNPRMPDERNFPLTPTLERILQDDSEFRVAVLAETNLYPPNMLQYYHIPAIGGYWTIASQRYLAFIKNAYGNNYISANGMLFLLHDKLNILRNLGAKYIVSDREIDSQEITLIPGISERTYLYEFNAPLPRLYCASDVSYFGEEVELLDNLKQLYLGQDRPLALVDKAGETQALTENCSIDEIQTRINNVTLRVTSDQPSYLVVPYNRSKHWHATVNGQPGDVLDANFTLMAIPIEAGTSEVKLYYQNSLSLWFAAAQIVLAVIVLLLILFSPARRCPRIVLAVLSLIVIVVATMEFPGVRNDNIPERVSKTDRLR